MKISVFNLGCKVNRYEADRLLGLIAERGHEAVDGLAFADIYIINTCAVTNEAEKKSRQAVARALKFNPDARVLVCGCASQNNAEQFQNIKGVTFVKGVASKDEILDRLNDIGASVDPLPSVYDEGGASCEMRTRGAIKISDGCNNFCSYCLIPYLRGRVRSRSFEEIKAEFDLLSQSHAEIVLTGIDMSSYGKDTGTNIVELLSALKNDKTRIRLGSLELSVISRELLEVMKSHKCFCDHFHLSLQSGSRDVLKAMNRHYTPEEYLEAVKLIREYFPDAAITTDIIAGFPTETEQQHEETKAFAREVAFADIHVFEYSKRDGTVAAKMKQVAPEIKKRRTAELIEIKEELRSKYLSRFLGKEADVVFEEDGGYTSNYIKVIIGDGDEAFAGRLVRVLLSQPDKDGIKGTLIEE